MPVAFRLRLAAAAFGLTAICQPASAQPPTQYVVISFDGVREVEQWERSRALARRTGAEFTYFLSCTNLLMRDDRDDYHPPHHQPGASNIGFADSRDDLALRLREIWAARLEGHDIASHGCGHFDGKDWSAQDWRSEFAEFRRIVGQAWEKNGIPYEPAGWRDFVKDGIVGFRAPYLSTGKGLYAALAADGFRYDASGVSNGPVEPPEKGGVVRFSLPMVPEGPGERPIIAMDYNLYYRHSKAKEEPDKAAEFEARALAAFRAAFERQHEGDRTPLQIGFHFKLMNDGAYWRALETFAAETCTKPDVRCVSYRELADILHPTETGAVGGSG